MGTQYWARYWTRYWTRYWAGVAVSMMLLTATPANAQNSRRAERLDLELNDILESRYEQVADLSAAETSRLDYGVYTIVAAGLADRLDRTSRVFGQVDSRFWLDGKKGGHRVYARLRVQYLWFDKGDAWRASGNGLQAPLADRYWYAFDYRKHRQATAGEDPAANFKVRIGRQLITWATGTVLRKTLYSLRLRGEWNFLHAELMVGQSPNQGFVDFDGSRPSFDTETDRLFYGAYLELQGFDNHKPYVYFLGQTDNNEAQLPSGARYQYDSYYLGIGSTGQLGGTIFYRAEFIYETGRSASDILGTFPQTLDDVSAWAAKFEMFWTPRAFPGVRGFRVDFEFLIGSGDSDRGNSAQTINGNRSGTKDNAFNGFGYYNTGLVLAPDLSNLMSLRISPRWRPNADKQQGSRLGIGADFFVFAKLDEDAPISVATVPGQAFIGTEIDLVLEWQFTSDLAMDARYGVFFPGDAILGSEPMHFVYLGGSYGF